MIYVCDAMMGSGKTSAAIAYMNGHPERKFIYVTPYLTEAERIRKACPSLRFAEPERSVHFERLSESEDGSIGQVQMRVVSKTKNTEDLLRRGRNITTTHQALAYYTRPMFDLIQALGYTLLIDECIDMLSKCRFNPIDIKVLLDAGFAAMTDGNIIHRTGKEYTYGRFNDIIRVLDSQDIIMFGKESRFWYFPIHSINVFQDVFVLTYLFDGQDMCYALRMNRIPYKRICVRRDERGYSFQEGFAPAPDGASDLVSKIHICDHEKLNAIGHKKTALSKNWFTQSSHSAEVDQLHNHIVNYFNHLTNVPSRQRLWTTFKSARPKLSGRNYVRRWIPMNARATNAYREATALVYAANIFSDPTKKLFFSGHGIQVDDDAYALSTLVQWVFRSAIRDGTDIQIYIPSRRMRELLQGWLDGLAG